MPSPEAPVADLIIRADDGDQAAVSALFATLYGELHTIAERQLHRGGTEPTLGTTTLLHEAYLVIAKREGAQFTSRAHFLSYAARSMRGLMIDYVRRRRAVKRGGEFHVTAMSEEALDRVALPAAEPLERLSEALDTLEQVDPKLAHLVDQHFFCGFSLVDIAQLRGVSDRTVQSDWRKARLLLHRFLSPT